MSASDLATLSYLYEIEINHQNILSAIEQSVNFKDIIRRGLNNAVSRLANVLYGSAEHIDIGFIFKKIPQFTKNNINNIYLYLKKKIVQTTITEVNSSLCHALTNQRKLEQNTQILNE